MKRFYADNQIQVIEWSPYSLYFNPIKHIWVILEQKLFFQYPKISKMKANTTSKVLFCQWLRETWDAIDQDTIKTPILSMKIDLWQ